MSILRYFQIRNVLKVLGVLATVGATTEVTSLMADSRGVLLAYGATVPTDAETGYATGCLFIDTNGGVGATIYVNEGDATSCDFNLAGLASGDITGVTAGLGLSGGGTSGAVTLNVDASHNVLYAGKHTTAGGDATEVATVSGVAATDIVMATIEDNGTNNVTLLQATPTTNTITFTLSGDPSTDAIISYTVFRAVA